MSDRYQHLRGLSTEKLEKLLQEDAQGSDDRYMDTEQMFYILQILEDRGAGNGADPQKALGTFRRDYMPREQRAQTRQAKAIPFRKYIWAAVASAAAAAALVVGVLWPAASGKGQALHLESLSANSVSIVDAQGRQTAVGTVEYDQYSISATIDPQEGTAEDYAYTAVVTYTYYPVNATGTDSLKTVTFELSTEEVGTSDTQITFFPGKIGGIYSASATFRAVEKKEDGKTVLQDATVEFPRLNGGI